MRDDMQPYYEDTKCGITIYHGDCREVLPTLDPVDLVLTDPPYSSGGQFRSDRMQSMSAKYVQTTSVETCRSEFSGDNLDQRAFLSWASMWLSQCYHATVDGGSLLMFTDWRQLPTASDAIQHGGWIWRNIVTWWKPGIRMQRGRFSSSAEYVLYASSGVPTPGEKSPQNVLECAVVNGEQKQHIAEKPAQLLRVLLGVTPLNSIVLDPFMGSGTTLVAAKAEGRRAIGIELTERYCEIAANRLAQGVFNWEAETEAAAR